MKADEYEIMFRVEDAHWWYRGLRRLILAHWRRFAPQGMPTALDAGCGTGAIMQNFAARAHFCGIDLSSEAIRFCRRRGLERTAVASLLHLPTTNARFDIVLSCDVLCHRNVDPEVALEEMTRVLRPGGLLMLNLPAYAWLLSSHDRAVYSARRFKRSEVLELLRRHSLEPLTATYWNTLLFAPIALVRLWRRRRPPPHSDLTITFRPWIGAILSAVLACERALIRLAPLPLGLSVFVVARKR